MSAIEDLETFSRQPMEDIYARFLEMALQIEEVQESRSEYEAELEAEISQANLETKLAKLETEALAALLERQSAQAEQQKNELNARIRAAEFNRAELTQSVQTLTKRTVNLERKQEQLDELNRALKQQIDDKDIRLEELEDEIALIGSDLSDRVQELEIANLDLWKARQRRRLTLEGQLPTTPGQRRRLTLEGQLPNTPGVVRKDTTTYGEMVAKLELESIVDDLKASQEKAKLFEACQAKNLALENEVKELHAQLAEEQARQARLEEDAKLRDSLRMEQLKQAESDQSEVRALRTAIEERAQAKQELEMLTNLVARGSSNEADAARLSELKLKFDAQTRERNKAVARRKQNRLMNPHEPPVPSSQPRGSTSAQFASLSPSLSFFAQGLRSNLLERRANSKVLGDDMGQGRIDLFKIRYIYVVQNTFPNSECKTIQISKAMTSFQKLLETVTKTFVFDAGPCRRLYFIDQDKETFTKLDRLDRVEDRAHYLAVGPEPFNPIAWDLSSTPRNCFHCEGKNHISTRRERDRVGGEDLSEPRGSSFAPHGLTSATLGALADPSPPGRSRRGSGASDTSNASTRSVGSNNSASWTMPHHRREPSASAMFARKPPQPPLPQLSPASSSSSFSSSERELVPSPRVSPSVTALAAAAAVAAVLTERAKPKMELEVIPDPGDAEGKKGPIRTHTPRANARAKIQGYKALSLPFPMKPPPPPSSVERVSTNFTSEMAPEDRPKTLSPPDALPGFGMKRSGSKTRLAFGKLVPVSNSPSSPPTRTRSRSPKPSRD